MLQLIGLLKMTCFDEVSDNMTHSNKSSHWRTENEYLASPDIPQ